MLSDVRMPCPWFHGEQRMDATGVVAKHPSDRAMRVRGRIWSEIQPLAQGLVPQSVQNAPGLNAGPAAARIHLNDAIHVFGEIQHDRHVAALASQTGPSAAAEHGRAKVMTSSQGGHHIIRVSRNDYSNRHLPVIRRIRGVDRPAARVKPHLRVRGGPQAAVQPVSRSGVRSGEGVLLCPGWLSVKLGIDTRPSPSPDPQQSLS